MTITPSHIIEYLFCPRFTYFEYVLRIPQYEEKHYKVEKGREVHDNRVKQNKEYLRKKVGAIKKETNVYLTNNLLRGEVDEVIWLKDDTMAPLDYKFAEYKDRIYDTYKTQLFCYGLLIEENYGLKVNKGFIVYTRSASKLVEIPIEREDKQHVYACAEAIQRIINDNFFPKATRYKKRCLTCTYSKICIK